MMIMLASYTSNMASFLTTQSLHLNLLTLRLKPPFLHLNLKHYIWT